MATYFAWLRLSRKEFSWRGTFYPVYAVLIKRNIRFHMAFPAVLSFNINGGRKTFKEATEAKAFLSSLEAVVDED